MKRLLVLTVIGYSLFSCEFLFCSPSLFASDGASSTHLPTQSFHGADLTKAPQTSDSKKLPDLWEERPKGSHSFEFRKDVKIVYSGLDGTVYYIPKKKCFYIQSVPLGSSTMTFFGPFPGDPTKVLKLETKPISE
jgi:hypothetical protein